MKQLEGAPGDTKYYFLDCIILKESDDAKLSDKKVSAIQHCNDGAPVEVD